MFNDDTYKFIIYLHERIYEFSIVKVCPRGSLLELLRSFMLDVYVLVGFWGRSARTLTIYELDIPQDLGISPILIGEDLIQYHTSVNNIIAVDA